MHANAQSLACTDVFAASASEAPVLTLSDILSPQPVGRGHFLASYASRPVFLKRLRTNSTEVKWLQRLNSLGLAVKLHGVVQLENHLYAVIDQAPGINTQMPMLAPGAFILTKAMVQDIHRQAAVLANDRIIPVDLQFQINPNTHEVKIIDPELFRAAESVEIAERETESIVRHLLMTWKLEDKIEN